MDELLASSLRMATPLLFAAMGGVLAERAGIATICLEGALILAAWCVHLRFTCSTTTVSMCTRCPRHALRVWLFVEVRRREFPPIRSSLTIQALRRPTRKR